MSNLSGNSAWIGYDFQPEGSWMIHDYPYYKCNLKAASEDYIITHLYGDKYVPDEYDLAYNLEIERKKEREIRYKKRTAEDALKNAERKQEPKCVMCGKVNNYLMQDEYGVFRKCKSCGYRKLIKRNKDL